MSDCWNSPLGVALGFTAVALLVYLLAFPLFWWRSRHHQRHWTLQQ